MKIRFYVFKKKKNLTLIISKFSKKSCLSLKNNCYVMVHVKSFVFLLKLLWTSFCEQYVQISFHDVTKKKITGVGSLWKESCTYSSAREVFKTPKHTFSVFSSFKNLRQKQLRVAVTYLCTIITPSVQRTATGNEVVPWVL